MADPWTLLPPVGLLASPETGILPAVAFGNKGDPALPAKACVIIVRRGVNSFSRGVIMVANGLI